MFQGQAVTLWENSFIHSFIHSFTHLTFHKSKRMVQNMSFI